MVKIIGWILVIWIMIGAFSKSGRESLGDIITPFMNEPIYIRVIIVIVLLIVLWVVLF